MATSAADFKNDPIMQYIAGQESVVGSNSRPTGTGEVQNMNLNDLINSLSSISYTNNAIAAANVADARNWNQKLTQWTMDFNASEAAKNRNWQEYMSNTAHQREVADLKAAGLNPVLSASGGNGAAVTSGSSASATAPQSGVAGVDESGQSALVSLLGSLLSAETQMRNTDVNARLNESIADRQRELNKYIAELQSATSLEATRMSGEASVKGAGLSAGAVYGAAQVAADAAMDRLLQEQGFEQWKLQNYPNNMYQMVDAVASAVFGDDWMKTGGSFIRDLIADIIDDYTDGKGSGSVKWNFADIAKAVAGKLGLGFRLPSYSDVFPGMSPAV